MIVTIKIADKGDDGEVSVTMSFDPPASDATDNSPAGHVGVEILDWLAKKNGASLTSVVGDDEEGNEVCTGEDD